MFSEWMVDFDYGPSVSPVCWVWSPWFICCFCSLVVSSGFRAPSYFTLESSFWCLVILIRSPQVRNRWVPIHSLMRHTETHNETHKEAGTNDDQGLHLRDELRKRRNRWKTREQRNFRRKKKHSTHFNIHMKILYKTNLETKFPTKKK